MPENIDIILIKELHNFLIQYYKDKLLADSIISNYISEEKITENEPVAPDIFFRILSYMQKITGDNLICFNAGRFFASSGLTRFGSVPLFGISLKRRYKKLNTLIAPVFPFLDVAVKNIKNGYLDLCIREKEHLKTNIYFYEYLRGIISSLPENLNLPFAAVIINSYRFDLEDILKENDQVYIIKENDIYVNDNKIAELKKSEKTDTGDDAYQPQAITDDLYIKDIYLKKNTVFNAGEIRLSATWQNFSGIFNLYGILLSIGIILFLFLFLSAAFPTVILVLSGFIYFLLLMLIRAFVKNKELKKIYGISENRFLSTIAEERNTSSAAISKTHDRIRSIENIIEITKKIIYEKNIIDLFDNIRKYIAKALNADRATVFIHDGETHELRSGPQLSEETQEFRIPETKGIAGEIFKLKKIVNIRDAYNNPNFDKAVDRKTGYQTRTILGAPLIDIGSNFIGVIQVLNKQGGAFDAIDEKILTTLSPYIASALKDTLKIHNLEKRLIDPGVEKGLNKVIQYLYKNNMMLRSYFSENSVISSENVIQTFDEILNFLNRLLVVFDESYAVSVQPVAITDVIDEAEKILNKYKNNKDINLKSNFAINQPPVQADVSLMYLIIESLLMNSIEAIPEKGDIEFVVFNYIKLPNEIIYEFSLSGILNLYNQNNDLNRNDFTEFLKSRKPLLDSELEKIISSVKKYTAFEIFDTGIQIDRDSADRIFHPFFSSKDQFGLGMNVAVNAARRMGGLIEEPRPRGSGKYIQVLIPDKNE